jgi:transcriptional regulator with XRE-family HTH domain
MAKINLSARLARNVKREREKRKLSQRGFGTIVKLSHAYINQIENATRDNVSISTIEQIANGLGIDPIVLLKERA